MNIAIIGYGKMGRAVEQEARERGHGLIAYLEQDTPHSEWDAALAQSEVAIEFTVPEAAVGNIERCISAGVPLAVGTTGWDKHLPEVEQMVRNRGGRLLHASNFSIGVNLFFQAAKRLAELIRANEDYHPIIEEVHHIHKKDAPSGTAIRLAQHVLPSFPHLNGWTLQSPGASPPEEQLPVRARREGEVFGLHTLSFDSEIDTIRLQHEAKSRRGFARGAVTASEWLVSQASGVYTMADYLGL